MKLNGFVDYLRPILDICIQELVPGTIDNGVACAKNSLFRQPCPSVAPGVRPAEEMELHLASLVPPALVHNELP